MIEAKHLRFWRGHIKTDITYTEFQKGLSTIFVPMTANLAKSPAKLISYHPVLFSEKNFLQFKWPAEIALVEYENEIDYRSFRETEEGKKYSNAHWDYFERSSSRSAVAENYVDQVDYDKAYYIESEQNPDLKNSTTFIKVYNRDTAVSDADWIEEIKNHITRTKSKSPRAVVILVDKNYVMEYSFWSESQDQFDPEFEKVSSLFFNHRILPGQNLLPDQGLKF